VHDARRRRAVVVVSMFCNHTRARFDKPNQIYLSYTIHTIITPRIRSSHYFTPSHVATHTLAVLITCNPLVNNANGAPPNEILAKRARMLARRALNFKRTSSTHLRLNSTRTPWHWSTLGYVTALINTNLLTTTNHHRLIERATTTPPPHQQPSQPGGGWDLSRRHNTCIVADEASAAAAAAAAAVSADTRMV
jgi:hypothetical protein